MWLTPPVTRLCAAPPGHCASNSHVSPPQIRDSQYVVYPAYGKNDASKIGASTLLTGTWAVVREFCDRTKECEQLGIRACRGGRSHRIGTLLSAVKQDKHGLCRRVRLELRPPMLQHSTLTPLLALWTHPPRDRQRHGRARRRVARLLWRAPARGDRQGQGGSMRGAFFPVRALWCFATRSHAGACARLRADRAPQ